MREKCMEYQNPTKLAKGEHLQADISTIILLEKFKTGKYSLCMRKFKVYKFSLYSLRPWRLWIALVLNHATFPDTTGGFKLGIYFTLKKPPIRKDKMQLTNRICSGEQML